MRILSSFKYNTIYVALIGEMIQFDGLKRTHQIWMKSNPLKARIWSANVSSVHPCCWKLSGRGWVLFTWPVSATWIAETSIMSQKPSDNSKCSNLWGRYLWNLRKPIPKFTLYKRDWSKTIAMWFSNMFYFCPYCWNDPIWQAYLSNGFKTPRSGNIRPPPRQGDAKANKGCHLVSFGGNESATFFW